MQWIESGELAQWLAGNIRQARQLCIASPFVTRAGLEPVLAELTRRGRHLEVTLLTSLDVLAALTQALDVEALRALMALSNEHCPVRVFHVPDLHAKVYLLDQRSAVVGSGNMTHAGTGGPNKELGVVVTGKNDLAILLAKLEKWRGTRVPLTEEELIRFADVVRDNLGAFNKLPSLKYGRLQTFPGHPDGYFAALMAALDVASSRTGCSREAMLQHLKNEEQGRDGSSTPTNRLLFLEYLDLVRHQDGRVCLTDRGTSLRRKRRGSATELMRLLGDKVGGFERIQAIFEREPARVLTYQQLHQELTGNAEADGKDEEMRKQVRWLRGLAVLEEAVRTADGYKTHRLVKRTRPRSAGTARPSHQDS